MSLLSGGRGRRAAQALLALILGIPPVGPALPVPGRLGSTSAFPAQRVRAGIPPAEPEPEPPLGAATSSQITPKQRREMMKANFEKMKRDAEELTTLAKALQEELDKASENVLSLQIVDKAEKIEKLAKRIKSTARGY